MSITRRRFLKAGVASGAFLGASVFSHPLVRRAWAATGNRYFIVLFLDGGNDGLNTVTPIDDGAGALRSSYESARFNLRLLPPTSGSDTANLLPIGFDPNTGAQLGLHPGLSGRSATVTQSGDAGFGGLKALYDAGMVAVIQGCGYPDYTLSHEESRSIWQTANPQYRSALLNTGWVGRHLAATFTGADVPAVAIADTVSPELRQFTTSVLAMERLADFEFPRDQQYAADHAAKDAAFLALHGLAGAGPQPARLIGTSGAATFDGTVSFPNAHSVYEADRSSWSLGYDDGGAGGSVNRRLARDFREVAKVIYAQERTPALSGIAARYFRLRLGGFDTHADQGANQQDGWHFGLHAEVGASLKHFFDDLADMDPTLPERIAVLVWSEFGRRVAQNGSGTDHGSQAPAFLIGGKVNGGIYGQHPNAAAADWNDDGNTRYRQSGDADPYALAFRSTDFRDVYGTILTRWLGVSDAAAQLVMPLDAGPGTDWWTVPNFDLRRFAGGVPLFRP